MRYYILKGDSFCRQKNASEIRETFLFLFFFLCFKLGNFSYKKKNTSRRNKFLSLRANSYKSALNIFLQELLPMKVCPFF